MAQKNFQPGKGTTWSIGSTPTALTGIRQHALPEQRHEQIEFTGNTDDAECYVNSPLAMSNEFQLQFNYDPANVGHNFLVTNKGTNQPMTVTTKEADGSNGFDWAFDVNIAAVVFPPHGNNEAARMDVTFRPTGPITRTAAL